MSLTHKHFLAAAFVLFVAWGLAVQSLPILRFVGYAFVLGASATLGLISVTILTVSRPFADGQYLDGPLSTPGFLRPEKWRSEVAQLKAHAAHHPVVLYVKSFVVSQALDSLLALALRDFVSSWYRNISSSPAFVNEIEKNIRAALVELRERLAREDMVNIVVTRIVPIVNNHLKDVDNAERVVKGRSLSRSMTESEELDLAIAAKYRDGKLHPAASLSYSDTKSIEQDYLRKIVVRILPDLVSDDIMSSRAVSVLVKEIVACAVLLPVVQLLKDPDTWNQIVENYGRSALQDRKTVRRMRAALDEHTTPSGKMKPEAEIPRLGPNDSERAFERFVRAIRKTKNLSDARRFRSQLASQLKRESIVEGQDPIYLRRLEMGKRVLDQKIAKLAISTGALPGVVSPDEPRRSLDSVRPPSRELSLVEVMHTSSGLSYFMEYMDRQGLMTLVQFWIVVDGFRNPLEDDFGDDPIGATTTPTWTDADRTDIAQISEAYLTKPEINTPQEMKDAVRAFLVSGRKATQEQYRAARTAILSAQSAVLDKLQNQHFPTFKRADLYYKFLASDEARAKVVETPLLPEPLDTGVSVAPLKPMKPSPAALHTNRTGSHGGTKSKDLRRAALSSSDIRSLDLSRANSETKTTPTDRESSAPLFDDGYDTDPLAHSNYSIGQESYNGDAADERQIVEDMEAAMTDIMAQPADHEAFEDEPDALFGSPTSSHRSMRGADSPRTSIDAQRIDAMTFTKSKPSLATLGLVNTASRIGVFRDNDLFPDEERFIEDEYANKVQTKDDPDEEIHEAAPGDLGLTEAISALTNDIERLVTQESVVDALTRKAELTNNVPELRILGKSKASLQREIRRKVLQRQQYIVQESDNSLYGRSSIKIKSIMVGHEDDGREFALYVIEVQRQAGDQMPAATWAVTRRYSEFHELHQRLRRRYPSTRNLDFPRRRMVMKLQKQFLHNRRVALESYLQQLLRMPDVCRSRELRSFLSQQAISTAEDSGTAGNTQDIVSRIYNSVTDGMDEFLGNMTVLDQLSVAGQNLISAATTQLGTTTTATGTTGGEIVGVGIEAGSVAEAEAELRAFEDKELEPFVKPICDIFLEIFELNRGNNWLRGRAVVVVLHQLLGGTVERKVRDFVKGLLQEDSLLKYIDMVKEIMWPGGTMRVAKPRTTVEKAKTRKEAGLVLATLLPDLAASVVGRGNAQAAARRITSTMNNVRLNQHLAYTVLDEIVGVLFDSARRG